jgi:hypothetical protein
MCQDCGKPLRVVETNLFWKNKTRDEFRDENPIKKEIENLNSEIIKLQEEQAKLNKEYDKNGRYLSKEKQYNLTREISLYFLGGKALELRRSRLTRTAGTIRLIHLLEWLSPALKNQVELAKCLEIKLPRTDDPNTTLVYNMLTDMNLDNQDGVYLFSALLDNQAAQLTLNFATGESADRTAKLYKSITTLQAMYQFVDDYFNG